MCVYIAITCVFVCNVGPLVRHWAMRFEAKHQYSKFLPSSMGNYINIAHSLALRHQTYQCYVLQDDNALSSTVECGPGMYIHVHSKSIQFVNSLLMYVGKCIKPTMTEFKDLISELVPEISSSSDLFWFVKNVCVCVCVCVCMCVYLCVLCLCIVHVHVLCHVL